MHINQNSKSRFQKALKEIVNYCGNEDKSRILTNHQVILSLDDMFVLRRTSIRRKKNYNAETSELEQNMHFDAS